MKKRKTVKSEQNGKEQVIKIDQKGKEEGKK